MLTMLDVVIYKQNVNPNPKGDSDNKFSDDELFWWLHNKEYDSFDHKINEHYSISTIGLSFELRSNELDVPLTLCSYQ